MILFVRIEHWALLCWQILVGMNHCQLWKPLADADLHKRGTFFCFSDRFCSNISRASLRPNIWQISRGLLSLVSTTPIIASNEVWSTDNVEQLQASLQPRGSVRFAAVSWEKDHTALFLCRAFFPLIFLNTELGSKNHMCFVYITREIRFLSNLKYCVFSENVLWK